MTGTPLREPSPPDEPETRLSTGFRLFLLLSLALLPLALIVVFSSAENRRAHLAEQEATGSLILNEVANRLGARLATDRAVLRNAADAGPSPLECARSRRLLDTGLGVTRFLLVSPNGSTVRCGALSPPLRALGRLAAERGAIQSRLVGDALLVAVPGRRGTAMVAYAQPVLARLLGMVGTASGGLPEGSMVSLRQGDAAMRLAGTAQAAPSRTQHLSAAVPGAGREREYTGRRPRMDVDQLLVMLLPLVMWITAAGIGWLVVDRLVLAPLGRLRSAAAGYRPGERLAPVTLARSTAREITDLLDTFRRITETVALHEGEMEDSLERQRRLTREVHHRVKNNLQVVASLISIHARGATRGEAADAYATIQRRVDALSVVHRNHYAEMEVNLGVALRPLVGEIAGNLRGSVPSGARMTVHVDVAPLHVTQDVAVPVAFMITELVELALACDPKPAVRITVAPEADPARARLIVASPALVGSPTLDARLAARYGRVLEGLARQLRTTLVRDADGGRFSLDFGLLVSS